MSVQIWEEEERSEMLGLRNAEDLTLQVSSFSRSILLARHCYRL